MANNLKKPDRPDDDGQGRGRGQRAPGEIDPNTLYTLDNAKQRLGWGDYAMRKARGNGLEPHRRHGRAYLMGGQIIRYITVDEDREAEN